MPPMPPMPSPSPSLSPSTPVPGPLADLSDLNDVVEVLANVCAPKLGLDLTIDPDAPPLTEKALLDRHGCPPEQVCTPMGTTSEEVMRLGVTGTRYGPLVTNCVMSAHKNHLDFYDAAGNKLVSAHYFYTHAQHYKLAWLWVSSSGPGWGVEGIRLAFQSSHAYGIFMHHVFHNQGHTEYFKTYLEVMIEEMEPGQYPDVYLQEFVVMDANTRDPSIFNSIKGLCMGDDQSGFFNRKFFRDFVKKHKAFKTYESTSLPR